MQAKVVLVSEVVLAQAQRMQQRARGTRHDAELRKVGLEAVSTAGKDTLCAIAVLAAAQAGVDMQHAGGGGGSRAAEGEVADRRGQGGPR
jgi:hypothetical protein